MINIVFFSAIAIGLSLFSYALVLSRQADPANFVKTKSDILLKSSILILGISFGLVSFFAQKWVEETNDQIQQSNESLSDIDMLQAEYMSQIEKGYFLNDNEFAAIYNNCHKELSANEDDVAYCDKDGPATAALSIDDATTAANYFDEPIDDISLSEFQHHFYDQTLLKRSVDSSVVQDIFLTNQLVINWFENIKSDYLLARVDGDAYKKKKSSLNQNLSIYSKKLCCSIKALYIDSEQLATHATRQAQNFCTIRSEISSRMHDWDWIVRSLSASYDEVKKRADDRKSCVFKPADMDPEVSGQIGPRLEIPQRVVPSPAPVK